MLDQTTYDLAQLSYMAQRGALVSRFADEIRAITEELASRGIYGGPTAGRIISAGAENLKARSKIAGDELVRACVSRNIAYSANLQEDLGDAFDRLTAADGPSIVNEIASNTGGLPNPVAIRGSAEGTMLQARLQGRLLAVAEFGHFVSKLEVAARDRAPRGADVLRAEEYDVFICHASEDKSAFVQPLAEALAALSLKTWYDRFVLKAGDSLSGRIDEGLRRSRFGIVVLSKNFFAKKWPEAEYRALVALNNSRTGEGRIIPVWHGVGREDVEKFSPLLLDIFAIDSKHGVGSAVAQIVEKVRPELTNSVTQAVAEEKRERFEEYDLAPYKVGDPGAPTDALPWQPFFTAQQPCLEVRFGEPQSVDLGGVRRWTIDCIITNVGLGAARSVTLFLPHVAVLNVDLLEPGRPVSRGDTIDDRFAFWNPVRTPAQTVFEYEDIAGVIFRQYGTLDQEPAPSGAFYKFRLRELGKPFRVKQRINQRKTPAGWLIERPR